MGRLMKILFVDNGADLQQKWIEPLRSKGWGVVRARSLEDADRMMSFHGDALQAIVVGEKFISFAEKNDLVFVVLTTSWTNKEIIAHQNSEHSAVGYVPYSGSPGELMKLFEDGSALKGTGTDGISLDAYNDMLAKPEVFSKGGGFQLDGPSVALGGIAFSAPPMQMHSAPASSHEVQEIDLGSDDLEVAPEPVEAIEEVSIPLPELEVSPQLVEAPKAPEMPATMILDPTRLSVGLDAANASNAALNLDEEADFDMSEVSSLDDLLGSAKEPSYNPQAFAPTTPSQLAINPTPSSQVSDVTTLKSYLALREQDVAVLTGQVRSSQERIQQLEQLLQVEKARCTELAHMVSKQEQTIKNYDLEKRVELEVLEKQSEDMSGQLRERTDKFRAVEAKLRLASEEVTKIKDRVRVDIRRIRVREKELENQLEVLKKDSSSLIQARDEKVLDLKRKIDLLEFNMELVQEQYSKERETSDNLRGRLKDAVTVMKQAGGFLEQ